MTTDAMLDTSRILKLAAEIRRVDGGHKCGAAELAERLMPFIDAHLAAECAKVVDALSFDDSLNWINPECERSYVDGWNACRESMLSAAPSHKETGDE